MSLKTPFSSPTELHHTVDQLRIARERFLIPRSVHSILSTLDRIVQLWLDPASAERREAEAMLPAETGLSPEMIRHTLPLLFQAYQAEGLAALLHDELSDEFALDTFVSAPGGLRKAYGPALITQVLAGNVPGAGLDGIIFALLVKSATLVKASSSSSLLPTLFARSLARIDPDLGACLAVVTWPGGSTALEDSAFSRADVVIVSGSDEGLAAIRQRVRGQFIGYGHKVSFSLIGRGAWPDAAELAQRAAYDIVLFDQQGCLSPQIVYVEEGGTVTPREFAALLAQAFAHWQNLLPRGKISLEISAAIRRIRDQAEWQALAGQDVALYTSPDDTAWTVIYEAGPAFVLSPLWRTVRVKPLASLAQLASVLAPWRPYLEAASIAATADRLLAVQEVLGQAGVSRICPLGTLQTPPLSWRHGGRPRVTDLVRWVGVENSGQ